MCKGTKVRYVREDLHTHICTKVYGTGCGVLNLAKAKKISDYETSFGFGNVKQQQAKVRLARPKHVLQIQNGFLTIPL